MNHQRVGKNTFAGVPPNFFWLMHPLLIALPCSLNYFLWSRQHGSMSRDCQAYIQLSQAFKALHRSFQSPCPFTERIDPGNIVMVNGVTANQQFVFRKIE